MREFSYIELGASLFVPASHKSLRTILSAERYSDLRSVVVDFEDGLEIGATLSALENLQESLPYITEQSPYIFLRPKNPKELEKFLALKNIERIDGFVLPKFSLENAYEYLDVLKKTTFKIMPSIEGEELFESAKLLQLRDILLENRERTVIVRYGLEDMLRVLGMRRVCEKSIFDYAVGNYLLGNFIAVFKSVGFAISGGVYPCYSDDEGFIRDVERDLFEGLFTKTIIHPRQIALTNRLYGVSEQEYREALEIIDSSAAVFGQGGKMVERVTMQRDSLEILRRYEVYGITRG